MTDASSHSGAVALTVVLSVLLMLSAAVGLVAWRTVYRSETSTLVDSAAAQDVITVLVGVLLLIIATVGAGTGSPLVSLAWPGLLAFVAYNAAIYCFSVHFGILFLAWVAQLGLSVFGMVATATLVDRAALQPLIGTVAAKTLAWVLIAAAVIFALLWLREIVPDLVAGRPSTSAAQWRVPTNPVHVLDLGLFLPAVLVAGVMILRGDPLGLRLGVPALVWLIVTCWPILLTPVMARLRGHEPSWGAVPPVAVLLVVFLAAGVLLARAVLSAPASS